MGNLAIAFFYGAVFGLIAVIVFNHGMTLERTRRRIYAFYMGGIFLMVGLGMSLIRDHLLQIPADQKRDFAEMVSFGLLILMVPAGVKWLRKQGKG